MFRILLIVAAFVAPSVHSENLPPVQKDSQEISNYIGTKYLSFIDEYVEVFIGHTICQYDFIDDKVFNTVADDSIREVNNKNMSVILSSETTAISKNDKELVNYISKLVTLTAIDVYSTAQSSKVSLQYENGLTNCNESKQKHHKIYKKLVKNWDRNS